MSESRIRMILLWIAVIAVTAFVLFGDEITAAFAEMTAGQAESMLDQILQ